MNWKDFLQKLLLRFSLYEDYQGKLLKLTQRITVAEFQIEFEDLMNKVTKISEPLLISFFIMGLKSTIRREMLMSRHSSLMESFAVARAIEAQLEDSISFSHTKPLWSSSSMPKVLQQQSKEVTSLLIVVPSPPSPATKPTTLPSLLPTPSLPIQRFFPMEVREKREKGLCYNCDQKWSSAH